MSTSFNPVVHRRLGSAVQSLPGGPGNGWAASGPMLGEGCERLRATSVCLPGLLLAGLPTATSSDCRRALLPPPPPVSPRLPPQGEWALSRGAQT